MFGPYCNVRYKAALKSMGKRQNVQLHARNSKMNVAEIPPAEDEAHAAQQNNNDSSESSTAAAVSDNASSQCISGPAHSVFQQFTHSSNLTFPAQFQHSCLINAEYASLAQNGSCHSCCCAYSICNRLKSGCAQNDIPGLNSQAWTPQQYASIVGNVYPGSHACSPWIACDGSYHYHHHHHHQQQQQQQQMLQQQQPTMPPFSTDVNSIPTASNIFLVHHGMLPYSKESFSYCHCPADSCSAIRQSVTRATYPVNVSENMIPATVCRPSVYIPSPVTSPALQRKEVEFVQNQSKVSEDSFPPSVSSNQSSDKEEAVQTNIPATSGLRYHTGAKLEKDHGRTPLFGEAPAWWNREESKPQSDFEISPKEDSERRLSNASTDVVNEKCSTEAAAEVGETATITKQQSIRMDIPFVNGSGETSSSNINRRENHAFTIHFNDDMSTTNMVALKKSTPPKQPVKQKSATVPKRSSYRPMKNVAKAVNDIETVVDVDSSKLEYACNKAGSLEDDNLSDSATYILERDYFANKSEIFETAHSKENDVDEENLVKKKGDKFGNENFFIQLGNNSPADSVEKVEYFLRTSSSTVRKREPLSTGADSSGCGGGSKAGGGGVVGCSKSGRSSPATARSSKAKSPLLTKSNVDKFTRRDGGRFSMRAPAQQQPQQQRAQTAVNSHKAASCSSSSSRQAGLSSKSKSAASSPRPETAAWLRRKEYNPLKKMMSSKVEADVSPTLLNSRSRSFHIGGNTAKSKLLVDVATSQRKLRTAATSDEHGKSSPKGQVFVQLSSLRQLQTQCVELLTLACGLKDRLQQKFHADMMKLPYSTTASSSLLQNNNNDDNNNNNNSCSTVIDADNSCPLSDVIKKLSVATSNFKVTEELIDRLPSTEQLFGISAANTCEIKVRCETSSVDIQIFVGPQFAGLIYAGTGDSLPRQDCLASRSSKEHFTLNIALSDVVSPLPIPDFRLQLESIEDGLIKVTDNKEHSIVALYSRGISVELKRCVAQSRDDLTRNNVLLIDDFGSLICLQENRFEDIQLDAECAFTVAGLLMSLVQEQNPQLSVATMDNCIWNSDNWITIMLNIGFAILLVGVVIVWSIFASKAKNLYLAKQNSKADSANRCPKISPSVPLTLDSMGNCCEPENHSPERTISDRSAQQQNSSSGVYSLPSQMVSPTTNSSFNNNKSVAIMKQPCQQEPSIQDSAIYQVAQLIPTLRKVNVSVDKGKLTTLRRIKAARWQSSQLTSGRGANRKYTEKHEWISVDNKIGTVGLTDYAQEALGEVVYIELPELQTELKQFAECGVVESVKAASDIYSPVSGTVAEVNRALEENPSLINKSCYDDGWLFKVEVANESELDTLMDEDKYNAFLKSENMNVAEIPPAEDEAHAAQQNNNDSSESSTAAAVSDNASSQCISGPAHSVFQQFTHSSNLTFPAQFQHSCLINAEYASLAQNGSCHSCCCAYSICNRLKSGCAQNDIPGLNSQAWTPQQYASIVGNVYPGSHACSPWIACDGSYHYHHHHHHQQQQQQQQMLQQQQPTMPPFSTDVNSIPTASNIFLVHHGMLPYSKESFSYCHCPADSCSAIRQSVTRATYPVNVSENMIPATVCRPSVYIPSPVTSPALQRKEVEFVQNQSKVSEDSFPPSVSSNQSSDKEEAVQTNIPATSGLRYHTGAKLEKDHGRTPLFGEAPAWWNREESKPQSDFEISPKEDSERRLSNASTDVVNEKCSTEAAAEVGETATITKQQSIRMDIPFVNGSGETSSSNINRRENHAFTIHFNDDMSTTNMVALKKSTPPKQPVKQKSATVPKRSSYRPMKNVAKAVNDIETVVDVDSSKLEYACNKAGSLEDDNLSDSATYILERDYFANKSEIFETAHSKENDVDEENLVKKKGDKFGNENFFIQLGNNSPADSVEKVEYFLRTSSSTVRKREPLSTGADSSGCGGGSKAGGGGVVGCSKSGRSSPATARSSKAKSPLLTKSNVDKFTRRDGGRFSMRAPAQQQPQQQRAQTAVNSHKAASCSSSSSRQAGLSSKSKSAASSPRPETAAWLRRKEYNPLKKMMSSKVEADVSPTLLNSRSRSFHIGGNTAKSKLLVDVATSQRKLRTAATSDEHGKSSPKGQVFVQLSSLRQLQTQCVELLTLACGLKDRLQQKFHADMMKLPYSTTASSSLLQNNNNDDNNNNNNSCSTVIDADNSCPLSDVIKKLSLLKSLLIDCRRLNNSLAYLLQTLAKMNYFGFVLPLLTIRLLLHACLGFFEILPTNASYQYVKVRCETSSVDIQIFVGPQFAGLIYAGTGDSLPRQDCLASRSSKEHFTLNIALSDDDDDDSDDHACGIVSDDLHYETVIFVQKFAAVETVEDTFYSIRCPKSCSNVANSSDVVSPLPIPDFRLQLESIEDGLIKVTDNKEHSIVALYSRGISVELKRCVAQSRDDLTRNNILLIDDFGCSLNSSRMGEFRFDRRNGFAESTFHPFKLNSTNTYMLQCEASASENENDFSSLICLQENRFEDIQLDAECAFTVAGLLMSLVQEQNPQLSVATMDNCIWNSDNWITIMLNIGFAILLVGVVIVWSIFASKAKNLYLAKQNSKADSANRCPKISPSVPLTLDSMGNCCEPENHSPERTISDRSAQQQNSSSGVYSLPSQMVSPTTNSSFNNNKSVAIMKQPCQQEPSIQDSAIYQVAQLIPTLRKVNVSVDKGKLTTLRRIKAARWQSSQLTSGRGGQEEEEEENAYEVPDQIHKPEVLPPKRKYYFNQIDNTTPTFSIKIIKYHQLVTRCCVLLIEEEFDFHFSHNFHEKYGCFLKSWYSCNFSFSLAKQIKLAEVSLFNATQRLWVSKSPSLANRKYTEKHEWISVDNKIGTVGLTDYAQEALGEVVYIELPELQTELKQFAECGVVESVKAASDIYSPVSGTVAEVNRALEENPSLINKSCYDDGWLFKVEVANESELDTLMDEDKYNAFLKSENFSILVQNCTLCPSLRDTTSNAIQNKPERNNSIIWWEFVYLYCVLQTAGVKALSSSQSQAARHSKRTDIDPIDCTMLKRHLSKGRKVYAVTKINNTE
ncbi:Glycine cleavage system H protein, mitochondrial [Trichinella spiralis]|uniref:Glycine cleavage system H protein, mitochondrial n=1 Tax=Trichinella spiralis TaxID=6334 RepID=A0A0V1ATX5_TRISP|nr:Glycine cleavage system H protein, mitochondrial [Trichinella spiralis]